MVDRTLRRRLLTGLVAALVAPWVRAAQEGTGGAGGHGSHGGHGGAGTGGTAPRAARPELNASLAVDAKGRFCAVSKRGEQVVFQRCEGAGASWSDPVPVSPAGERVAAGGDLRPKIAIGADGVIHVSWTKPLTKPYTGEIRYARSLDGGASFQPAQTVHADRQEITHRFDALAVTSEGKVVVAWIDKRDQVRAAATAGAVLGTGAAATAAAKAVAATAAGPAAPAYIGAALYFAVSDDAGATFRGDYRLAEHSCECCRIALQPAPDGSLIALWRHVFEPNVRDHAMARLSPDGTAEAFARATFDGWRIDACPHHGPSLALGADGTRHAVWFADGRLTYGLLGGGQVRAAFPIGGAAAGHADLVCAGDRLMIAAQAFDGTVMNLLRWVSNDAGKTWTALRPVAANGPTGHPFVVVRDGHFAVLWPNRDEPLRLLEAS